MERWYLTGDCCPVPGSFEIQPEMHGAITGILLSEKDGSAPFASLVRPLRLMDAEKRYRQDQTWCEISIGTAMRRQSCFMKRLDCCETANGLNTG